MPISSAQLRSAAARVAQTRSLSEARQAGLQTAFLCHSHLDATLAKGLAALLESSGWRVYVDWNDPGMPPTPTRETAVKIQAKIVGYYWFLFLATANSMASRWCPWEIGYADGMKPIERIVIVPTVDDGGTSHGNEYLQLYRRLEYSNLNKLGVWNPGTTTNGILVESL